MIGKSLDLLTKKEKWRLSIVLLGSVAVGLLQILGVGSILPLLAVIAEPDEIREQFVVEFVSGFIEFSDTSSIVVFLASMAFVLIVASNLLSTVTAWVTFRFVWSVHSRLSTELLSRYMSHPYEVLLTRNPAEAEKNILEEVVVFTSGVMRPILRMVVSGVVVLFLVVFLIWFNPVMAVISIVFLGGGYVITFLLVRRSLTNAGNRRVVANEARFKSTSEAIGGVKEIQVLGRSMDFVRRYREPSQEYARATALQNIIAEMPRYTIEVLAFGSILSIALYVAISSGDLTEIAPIISVYALAGYRLIPAMQRVYSDWSGIRFNQVVVPILHQVHVEAEAARLDEATDDPGRLVLSDAIRITELDYHYPKSDEQIFSRLNLTIKRGETVSFVGGTGSGKTTLVELLIGILRPSGGSIHVDDTELDRQSVRRWQNSVGYVPQEIYLIDDSVAANIALGVSQDQVDFDRVVEAARVANIHNFVIDELPEKYETVIGARGVRLSGGQRQRIGIARAVYHEPSVLFLDEATSNLDQETEQLMHETLDEISKDMTVIIVAHRLRTTRTSDMIYVLNHGKIVGSGKYGDLVDGDGNLLSEYSIQRED